MRLRTLSTLLSQALSHLPGAEYERAKCEGLAAQVSEQRAHIEDLARRLEYATRQKDEAEEAHVDAYEIRLDKIEGERDAIKAQYEAEKAAHGDTQRHLTAAIAERDEAQSKCRSVQILADHRAEERADGWKKIADLEKRAEAAETRVVELQAGEPVGWLVKTASGENFMDVKPHLGADRGVFATPLYAAPKPAAPAHGVEEERFVCLLDEQCMTIANRRETGTREEAESRTRLDGDAKVMRLVDADAPVVDVDKIREVIADLGTSCPRLFASESAHLLRAAIGEKA